MAGQNLQWMSTVLAPNAPASAVLAIEAQLGAELSPLQARVAALRIVISRLGEQDAWRWWPSEIWRRGALVFSRVFEHTWDKQRALLALAAARAAEDQALQRPQPNIKASLFRLEARFDALLDHALSIVGDERYKAVAQVIDGLDLGSPGTLGSLSNLARIEDPTFSDVSSALAEITSETAKMSSSDPWVPVAVR